MELHRVPRCEIRKSVGILWRPWTHPGPVQLFLLEKMGAITFKFFRAVRAEIESSAYVTVKIVNIQKKKVPFFFSLSRYVTFNLRRKCFENRHSLKKYISP